MKCLSIMTASAFIALYSAGMTTVIGIPGDYPAIQQGIEASANGDTVLVQPGTYVENINFSGRDITVGSLFLTTGDTAYIASTIIDGDSSGSVVTFENFETNSAVLTGFTIRRGYAAEGGGIKCIDASPVITRNIITNNEAFETLGGKGGGVYSYLSDMILSENLIFGNYAEGALEGLGGGVYCGYYDPTIRDNIIFNNLGGTGGGGVYYRSAHGVISGNIIAGNRGVFWGGGLYLDESSPLIINNTISRNDARWDEGGAIYCENNSNPLIVNTILWADSAFRESNEIYVEDGSPIVIYCDVDGGWYGEGNIDLDPLFRDPQADDFHLMSPHCGDPDDSPCIDTGSPEYIDSLLDCSRGLGTILSDLGAYGGGDSATVGIDDSFGTLPRKLAVFGNHPNPFNGSTMILYVLPEAGEVEIAVFDILGRDVETILRAEQGAGEHRVSWDGSNHPSGIYFTRVASKGLSLTIRMLLLK